MRSVNTRRVGTLGVVAVLSIGVARRPVAQGADDRAQIAALNTAIESATRHMDNAASLALWADDGVSLTPNANALVGKPAIAAFFETVMKQIAGATMTSFEMRCFDITIARPLATEWCVEHQVVLLADKTTFDGWGKIGFVLRRGADGKWQLKQETWLPGLPSDSILLRSARR